MLVKREVIVRAVVEFESTYYPKVVSGEQDFEDAMKEDIENPEFVFMLGEGDYTIELGDEVE